jgi:hypothetical protein
VRIVPQSEHERLEHVAVFIQRERRMQAWGIKRRAGATLLHLDHRVILRD